MCRVGVSNEGRCSFATNRLSNDGKWVFNKACAMPWCHTVVHFEVKMSRFGDMFHDNQPSCGGTPPKRAVFLPR